MHDPLASLLHFAPPILVGALLLVAGRRLFWLFVAVIGFLVAARVAAEFIDPHQQGTLLIVALVAGVCGAILAIAAQKFAIAVGGAIAGAFYLSSVLPRLGLQQTGPPWVPIIIGAILGAILMVLLFNWALIFFSSVAGAHLVVHSLAPLSHQTSLILSISLVVVGILIQGRLLALHTRRADA